MLRKCLWLEVSRGVACHGIMKVRGKSSFSSAHGDSVFLEVGKGTLGIKKR